MTDPANPIADDIRRWANDATALEPVQDWDLLLAAVPQEDLYLELASSDTCPKADYFRALLYLLVGDAVRTGYQAHRKDGIEGLLSKAEARFPKRCIFMWVQRSRDLMQHPERFQYEEWCAGGLARKPAE